MAEKLCELKKKGGGSSSLIETVLWTNSSPTTSFPETQVSLSQSINNFDYLKFVFRGSTSNSSECENLISVVSFKQLTGNSSTEKFTHFGSPIWGTSSSFCRLIDYVSNTSVLIRICYQIYAQSSNNTKLIPLKIIGIK